MEALLNFTPQFSYTGDREAWEMFVNAEEPNGAHCAHLFDPSTWRNRMARGKWCHRSPGVDGVFCAKHAPAVLELRATVALDELPAFVDLLREARTLRAALEVQLLRVAETEQRWHREVQTRVRHVHAGRSAEQMSALDAIDVDPSPLPT